jgi:purine-nucleoside phosphorylase
MEGYTGYFQGKRVSVQGTGMGMPSLAIYASELINEYGVKNLIRIGSCGAMQKEVALHDLIIAMGACTDSSFNFRRFEGLDYAPLADWKLLSSCVSIAQEKGFPYHVGNVFSTDQFYSPEPRAWKRFAAYQVLAVEMESAALFTLAAQHGVSALAILTVSDHLITQEALSAKEREQGFHDMAVLGLSLATAEEWRR